MIRSSRVLGLFEHLFDLRSPCFRESADHCAFECPLEEMQEQENGIRGRIIIES